MQLTPNASQALTNLRVSGDFKVFMEWVAENESKEVDRALNTDGTQCYRAQGGAKVLKELREAFENAPDVLQKFRQQR